MIKLACEQNCQLFRICTKKSRLVLFSTLSIFSLQSCFYLRLEMLWLVIWLMTTWAATGQLFYLRMSHANETFGFDIGSNMVVETKRKIYLHATEKLVEYAIVLGCFLRIIFFFQSLKTPQPILWKMTLATAGVPSISVVCERIFIF